MRRVLTQWTWTPASLSSSDEESSVASYHESEDELAWMAVPTPPFRDSKERFGDDTTKLRARRLPRPRLEELLAESHMRNQRSGRVDDYRSRENSFEPLGSLSGSSQSPLLANSRQTSVNFRYSLCSSPSVHSRHSPYKLKRRRSRLHHEREHQFAQSPWSHHSSRRSLGGRQKHSNSAEFLDISESSLPRRENRRRGHFSTDSFDSSSRRSSESVEVLNPHGNLQKHTFETTQSATPQEFDFASSEWEKQAAEWERELLNPTEEREKSLPKESALLGAILGSIKEESLFIHCMDWLYTPFSKVLLFHPKKAAHSPGEMIRLMLRGSSKLSSLLKLMRVGGLASRPLTLAHLYTLSFFDAAGDIFTMLNFLDQTDVQFEMIPCDFEVVTDTLRRESMIYRTIAETSEYEEGSTKLRQIWLMRRRWWFIQEIDHLWHGVLYLVGPQGTRTRAILRGIALDPVEGERLEVLTDDVAHIEEWATCRIEYLTGGDVPTFDPMLCLNKMQSFYELSWKATKFRDMKHSHFMPETPLIITAGSHPATLAYLLNRQMPVRAIVKLADSLARDEHLLRVLGNEMPTSVLPDVAKHISNKPPETSADLFYSVSVAKIRATLQKLTCHRLSREETLVFEELFAWCGTKRKMKIADAPFALVLSERTAIVLSVLSWALINSVDRTRVHIYCDSIQEQRELLENIGVLTAPWALADPVSARPNQESLNSIALLGYDPLYSDLRCHEFCGTEVQIDNWSPELRDLISWYSSLTTAHLVSVQFRSALLPHLFGWLQNALEDWDTLVIPIPQSSRSLTIPRQKRGAMASFVLFLIRKFGPACNDMYADIFGIDCTLQEGNLDIRSVTDDLRRLISAHGRKSISQWQTKIMEKSQVFLSSPISSLYTARSGHESDFTISWPYADILFFYGSQRTLLSTFNVVCAQFLGTPKVVLVIPPSTPAEASDAKRPELDLETTTAASQSTNTPLFHPLTLPLDINSATGVTVVRDTFEGIALNPADIPSAALQPHIMSYANGVQETAANPYTSICLPG